jgi:hypothetical protein
MQSSRWDFACCSTPTTSLRETIHFWPIVSREISESVIVVAESDERIDNEANRGVELIDARVHVEFFAGIGQGSGEWWSAFYRIGLITSCTSLGCADEWNVAVVKRNLCDKR